MGLQELWKQRLETHAKNLFNLEKKRYILLYFQRLPAYLDSMDEELHFLLNIK